MDPGADRLSGQGSSQGRGDLAKFQGKFLDKRLQRLGEMVVVPELDRFEPAVNLPQNRNILGGKTLFGKFWAVGDFRLPPSS